MEITGKKILLRDMIEKDIDDRIFWETEETEWQDWDAPWESEQETFNIKQYRINMRRRLSEKLEPNRFRYGFQICILDEAKTHIGWINAYHIDDAYCYSRNGEKLAIGIDIPNMKARRKGYASEAWTLYIKYLLSYDIQDIYTQTWSGNKRVIGLMTKLGFEECHRCYHQHVVKGEMYDALTFKLNLSRFENVSG